VGSIDSGAFRNVQQQAAQAEQAQAQRYANGAFEPPQLRASPAANVTTSVSMVCNSARPPAKRSARLYVWCAQRYQQLPAWLYGRLSLCWHI
jgi:hypothetical protein